MQMAFHILFLISTCTTTLDAVPALEHDPISRPAHNHHIDGTDTYIKQTVLLKLLS